MPGSRSLYEDIASSTKFVMNDPITSPDQKLIVAWLARQIADDLKRDNRAFRYDKFFEACGLDEHGEPPKKDS